MSVKYYIISKIELVDSEPATTAVGYVLNEAEAIQASADYNDYVQWIRTNRSDLIAGSTNISEFFNTTPKVYFNNLTVDTIEGLGLSEITDLNTLV